MSKNHQGFSARDEGCKFREDKYFIRTYLHSLYFFKIPKPLQPLSQWIIDQLSYLHRTKQRKKFIEYTNFKI